MKNKLVLFIMVCPCCCGYSGSAALTSTYSTNLVWEQKSKPVLHEDMLALELVAEGLGSPTSMRFLDDGTILILEKNNGQVRVVLDGKLLEEPAIQVEVANGAEQGLLGIATWTEKNYTTSVFLYLTENYEDKTRNRVYKYIYDNTRRTLENKTLVLDLPADPGPFHNGGNSNWAS